MTNETYVIGPSSMTVGPLSQVPPVEGPFIALVPATDLTQLPATLDALTSLLQCGCADLILAGPRAEAFQEQVRFVIDQEGSATAFSTYPDFNDACNAALLGALVRRTGLALCADEPEMLETLRGVAQMNGWTKASAKPTARVRRATGVPQPVRSAKSGPIPKPVVTVKSGPIAKAAKPAAKAKPAKPAAKKKANPKKSKR